MGFAQKYVNAFYCGSDIPEQENSGAYYPFILKKAKELLKKTPIKDVIRATYSGTFVDEYQDCTTTQHDFINVLSSILPTHILGDHLQGIFGFNEELLVDFEKELIDFEKFPDLTEPWRWKNTNPNLGDSLKNIRELLEKNTKIDLSKYMKHIEVIQVKEDDKYKYGSDYNKKIWELTKLDNVLIIHPNSTNLYVRKDFIERFKNTFNLVEAIDDKDFYNYSHELDKCSPSNFFTIIYDLIPKLFNGTTNRDKWFCENGVKNKRSKDDKNIIGPICNDIEKIKQQFSLFLISILLKKIKYLPDIKCYRKELFSDLCNALEQAEYKSVTVYDAMKEIRNIKRRKGRKISGRCIGTTLLTKGLEFDTVVVLDTHNFKCPKNFYVAITRACKRLIIFTKDLILSPYKTDCKEKVVLV